MSCRGLHDEQGAIPFVVVGVIALGGVLGAAWAGGEWSQMLVGRAGGELTAWVLRGAFWALDLVALQASTAPTTTDWYTPVIEGPALPLYALAALVMVATLIAETIAGIVTGNTTRIVQAVIRAIVAGMLATVGAGLLLAIGGALSDLGRIALDASGAGVDAPLVPLQEVLMDTAEQREAGAELFIAFLAGLVIVFTSLAIYFTLAMRPVLLAAVIVFLPIAHALGVWTPMRRVEVRTWALGFAVLLADAAILTMFAVTNTVIGQPQGVDRLIFGTFGLLLAALAPAALARIIGLPELHTAVQSMTRGSRVVAAGAGIMAAKGALLAAATGASAAGAAAAGGRGGGGGGGAAGSAFDGPGPGTGPGSAGSSGPAGGTAGGSSAAAPSDRVPAQSGSSAPSGTAARSEVGTSSRPSAGVSSTGSSPTAGQRPSGSPGGAAGSLGRDIFSRAGWGPVVTELPTYRFPARPAVGLLFGLSLSRMIMLGGAGLTLIVVTARPSPAAIVAGGFAIVALVAAAAVKVAGRALVDWLPVAVGFVWRQASRNNEFYASCDFADPPLPDGVLDLPGELFGLELHAYTATQPRASVANPTVADYGIVVDTYRDRLAVIAEVSGHDLLFLDGDEQQGRFAGWGSLLDHIGQSMPELVRLQLVHLCAAATSGPATGWHSEHGGHGNDATATSYRRLLESAATAGQQHRLLLAVALDRRGARRQIRQAGGGRDGAATVLLDRAAQLEQALAGAGIEVHGWLPARQVAAVLRAGFDPAAAGELDARGDDVNAGAGCDPVAAGPAAMVESWTALRLESGWAATCQVTGPPSRPVTGEFLQHLLIGVPATRRMSLLYIPMPPQTAERRAQTQQVTAESEQALRVRWGFSASARHRRSHGDAAQREADLVEGRAVFRLVWTITITAPAMSELDVAVGQIEAAARRCGLELRRLVGTQRQAASFTLPLCRGAR